MTGLVLVHTTHKDMQSFLEHASAALEHRGRETPLSIQGPDSDETCSLILRTWLPQNINHNDHVEVLITPTGVREIPLMLDETNLGSILLRVNANGLMLQRSVDGSKPLFYCSGQESLWVATERKALWAAGLTHVQSLPPGHQLNYRHGNVQVSRWVNPLRISTRRDLSEGEFLSSLHTAALTAFERLRAVKKCGVLFSGGVDSSLAALLTARFCPETHLISAFAQGSHDEKVVTDAAEQLGLPLHIFPLDSDEIWHALPHVIRAIETTNRMDVEIAIPFYFAAKKAKELGLPLLVSGQGPDELFAGYTRYVRLYEQRGATELERALLHDVSITHETNIERDEMAMGSSGVNSLFPYLDRTFVRLALSIPAELKIHPDENPNRKLIFRTLAMQMGLDETIALRPKRATQYSSGTKKLLLDAIAKHNENYAHYSHKRLELVVQKVLNLIGAGIGEPTHAKKD